MKEFILNNSESTLNKFILVRKVQTPIYPSDVLFQGEKIIHLEETISEFSFYQNLIFVPRQDSSEIVHQRESGYLVRTKNKETVKGGIAINASYLDTLAL